MARRPVYLSFFHFASLSIVLFSMGVAVPAMAEGGNGGYEYCYTNYPGATGYVAGQPTYISAVFHFPGDSYNGPKLFDYVKQHYGVANPGPVGCSYGSRAEQAQNGLTAALAKIKGGGYAVIETGWTLNGAPAIAASPAAAAPGSPYIAASASTTAPAIGKTYTFCTVAAGKNYVSAVMPDPNPHMKGVNAFRAYLKQKYNPPSAIPLPSCGTYDSLDYANEMFHQWVLTEGPSLVQTGWTYNGSAAGPAMAAAAPMPSTPTAAPAASAPPVQGTVTVRLVDPVNSFTDPPGKRYRAVVTQGVTIGNVNIPVDTLSTVTVSGTAGNLSAHLTTLAPNGQQPLNVTTSAVAPVTAGSNAAIAAAAAGAKQVQSIMSIGGFGKKASAPKAVTVMAQGDKVVLPPGTTLSFTTSVPQSSASTPAPTPSSGPPTL